MPPIRIETSDSVLIFTPLALKDASMPLAFQKRVPSWTRWSNGAFTKIRVVTKSSVGSSWEETTRPTSMRRKKTGEPTLIAPAPVDRNSKKRPGSWAVTTGGSSRPTKCRLRLPSRTGSTPM